MEKAFRITIGGRVTGVGFRYRTWRTAAALGGLCGYVRNVGYGKVEVLLQGTEDRVETMLAWLRTGPPGARVDRFDLVPVLRDPELKDFSIR